MTDVKLIYSSGGMDIETLDGRIVMDNGIISSMLLCLFGGNDYDAGGTEQAYSWWGNLTIPDTDKQYRSRFQYLSQILPLNSANMNRIKQAVEEDIQPLIDGGALTNVTVDLIMAAPKKLSITIYSEQTGLVNLAVLWSNL